jgi:hypothetical protein
MSTVHLAIAPKKGKLTDLEPVMTCDNIQPEAVLRRASTASPLAARSTLGKTT